jgi:hypothetical protein
MKKKYDVSATVEVDLNYTVEVESDEQYMEVIGAIDMINYDEPIFVQLPSGQVIKLNISNLQLVDQSVELHDGEDNEF